MSSYSRNIKLLQKLNSVEEEWSDNKQGISDVEDTDSDNEIIIISSDSEKEDEPTESGADGTVWQEINLGYQTGRTPIQNVFHETSCPTGYENIIFWQFIKQS